VFLTSTTITLITIGIGLLVCAPLMGMLKTVVPGLLLRSSGVEEIEASLYALQSQAHSLQHELHQAIAERNRLFNEVGRLRTEIRRLEKQTAEARNPRPEFIHELGEPQAGLQRFTARLDREYHNATNQVAGERLEPNPLWSYDNRLEVWARNPDEARQLAETAYSIKLGYLKQFAMVAPPPPQGSQGRSPSADSQVRQPRRARAR